MRLARKLISAILAVSSVVSLSACAPANASWAAEYKGEKLPVGVYLNEMVNAYYLAGTKVEDQTKNVLKQQIEGKDAKAWITEQAAQSIKEYYAVNDKFDELGLKLSEDDIKTIKANAENEYDAYKEYYEKNGIGLSSIVLINTNAKKSNMVFDKYFAKGGITPVSESDIKASINSENVKVTAMPFNLKPSGTDKLSDEEIAKIKERANSYLVRAQAGEKIADLIYEAEKAQSDKPEQIKRQEDDYYNTIVTKSNTTPAIQKLFETAAAKKSGEVFMVEHEDYIFVVKKLDLTQQDYDDRAEQAIYTLKSDEYHDMIKKWAESINVSFNEKATKYYTVSKLKLQ
ncbi:MAG TPA: hypothetical protein DCP97_04385 [Ruminococcaceae bacterium]|mgnify:CR=1 FL=1|nr:hypothetical protein [Oscillospiraceae bacterium]